MHTGPSNELLNPAGQPASHLVVQTMAAYGIEQGDLEFVDSGTWTYASESSAVVALETSERATVRLECADLSENVEQEALHYLHIFHLSNLKTDREYVFKATATSRTGQTATITSLSVRTKPQPKAIRIPGNLAGPPYVLDQPNTFYLVTEDIAALDTALRIAASGVTLDLGGHTVCYNQDVAALEGDGLVSESEPDDANFAADDVSISDGWRLGAYGIAFSPGLQGVRIFNGSLRQGDGGNEGAQCTIGFNPIIADQPKDLEVAGVSATYFGTQLSGVVLRASGPDVRLHHNAINDQGRLISNRHKMCCAIRLESDGGGELHHNLVVRARQSALGNTGQRVRVYHNELHIDSHSINSFGIAVKDNSEVYCNRIFGCGNNVVGIATTGGCQHVKLYRNYIWLQAHNISEYLKHLNTKEMESAPYSIMSGVRITWGCRDVDYHDNTILVTARDGGFVRGTFLYNDANVHEARFRDNLVIALTEDELSHGWGAIAGVGNETRGNVESLLFSGNTIVSNFACFNMQDTYGVSINYHFVDNTFVRVGNRPDFAVVRAREVRPSRGHVFRDNRFENGAGLDRVLIGAEDAFEVQWTCSLNLIPGAHVTVTSVMDEQVFKGTVDDAGCLAIPLTHYRQEGARRIDFTPYTVNVIFRGQHQTILIEGPN